MQSININSFILPIRAEAILILSHLIKNGFETTIVGGAVRDILSLAFNSTQSDQADDISLSEAMESIDYDFATSAKPEEIQALFPESFYENKFGTVSLTSKHVLKQFGKVLQEDKKHGENPNAGGNNQKVIDLTKATKVHHSLINNLLQKSETEKAKIKQKSNLFEITTYRSDEVYSNHRSPTTLVWGNSLADDLKRRDFTINSLALNIENSLLDELIKPSQLPRFVLLKFNQDLQLIDQHQGLHDLVSKIIRTVGEPNLRFQEDALRMLRAIRLSVQLEMQIDDQTFEAIIQNASLIEHISSERIRDEFLKMLASDHPRTAIELLDETGLLKYILPELSEAKGVLQGGHHTTDVWEHSLDSLACCPSPDPIVRLATLIHDIAKPLTHQEIDGQHTFYNHEIVGSRIAKKIGEHFNFSKKDKDRLFILVRFHMFHYQPENSDASIRRFMRKVGLENIDDILDLREGDRLGSGARKTSWRLEEMKKRMIDQLHQPFAITDLAINGDNLINELGLKPGPKIGRILKLLFEEVLEKPENNTKDYLLEKASKL